MLGTDRYEQEGFYSKAPDKNGEQKGTVCHRASSVEGLGQGKAGWQLVPRQEIRQQSWSTSTDHSGTEASNCQQSHGTEKRNYSSHPGQDSHLPSQEDNQQRSCCSKRRNRRQAGKPQVCRTVRSELGGERKRPKQSVPSSSSIETVFVPTPL